MSLITIPARPADTHEAMACVVCGTDATRAAVPLCAEHHRAWCESADSRLAYEVETKLREGFAAKLREGRR